MVSAFVCPRSDVTNVVLFHRNPWLCLPLEVLKAFTTQFVAVAVGIFCSSAAPAALFLTLCGLNHVNLALGKSKIQNQHEREMIAK